MNNPNTISDAFIFMKVGNHAGETFEKILDRKRKEYETTGMTFWGYGGASCHPVKQVRPFALTHLKKRGSIYLLMNFVKSNYDQDTMSAREYSKDGITWEPIPKGINVTGSKYAIVLDEIVPTDLVININEYKVGIGPSRDKTAAEYLKGRTDKACLMYDPFSTIEDEKPIERKIDFAAKMQDPFAVLLRY